MSFTASKRWYFEKKPVGFIDKDTLSFRQESIPELQEGQFLFKTLYLSLDATNRVWLSDWDIYMPPVEIGEPMRGFVFGRVLQSKNKEFPEGSYAAGLHSWSDIIVTDGDGFSVFPELVDLDSAQAFAILSIAGPTAHVGLLEIGKLKAGETLVVSGAAGAVGLMAGQIAKIKGCRVIGIAGTDEKCALLENDYNFDETINYKTEDVTRRLAELCPNGIDLCFENVGGKILDASLTHMKDFGRVVICGLISTYNAKEEVPGPYMFRNVIMRRLSIRGFVVLDHQESLPKILLDLIGWIKEDKLKMPVHVVEGLENAADALNLLYTGGNVGKVLVKL